MPRRKGPNDRRAPGQMVDWSGWSKRIMIVGASSWTGPTSPPKGGALPSLSQLDEAIRAFLEEYPGFTSSDVTVVVDATFGHRIDPSEVGAFEQAVDHSEMVTPPAGAIGRGDGFILRIAEKSGALVLSNDSFQEFHAERPMALRHRPVDRGKAGPRRRMGVHPPDAGAGGEESVGDRHGRSGTRLWTPTIWPCPPTSDPADQIVSEGGGSRSTGPVRAVQGTVSTDADNTPSVTSGHDHKATKAVKAGKATKAEKAGKAGKRERQRRRKRPARPAKRRRPPRRTKPPRQTRRPNRPRPPRRQRGPVGQGAPPKSRRRGRRRRRSRPPAAGGTTKRGSPAQRGPTKSATKARPRGAPTGPPTARTRRAVKAGAKAGVLLDDHAADGTKKARKVTESGPAAGRVTMGPRRGRDPDGIGPAGPGTAKVRR